MIFVFFDDKCRLLRQQRAVNLTATGGDAFEEELLTTVINRGIKNSTSKKLNQIM